MQGAFPAFWILRSEEGQWNWQFAAKEGEFTAGGTRSYDTQAECLDAIRAMTATRKLAIFSTIDDDASLQASPASQPAKGADRAPLDLTPSQIAKDDPAPASRDPFAQNAASSRNGDAVPTIRNMRLRPPPAREPSRNDKVPSE